MKLSVSSRNLGRAVDFMKLWIYTQILQDLELWEVMSQSQKSSVKLKQRHVPYIVVKFIIFRKKKTIKAIYLCDPV